MKTAPLLSLLLFASLPTGAAHADDKAACLAANQKGQRARDQHKLVEAREQLRICAAQSCPPIVQGDCLTWLAEVEKALPTVVVVAKSGSGVDLVDARVSIDGQPLGVKLEGQSLPMNPGAHAFHFEAPDGTTLDRQVVVKEGEKNQSVSVVLGPVPSAPVVGPGPLAPSSPPAAAPASGSGLRTAGWALGGVGVAGLAAGAVFGGLVFSAKGSDCTGNVCKPGTTSGIKTDALLSDVGFIAGGVLLAAGGAILIFGPRPGQDGAASLRVAPTVGASGGGFVAGGSF